MRVGLINGQIVDATNLPPELFDDIQACAHALSLNCRYNGNVLFHYSVAQHSVLLSEAVPPHLARAALIHDMSEWVFGDLIAPVKDALPIFGELEDVCLKQIFFHFGVPWECMAELKPYDKRIYIDETLVLNPRLRANYPVDQDPLGVEIEEWPAGSAKWAFLDRFEELFDVAA